MRSKVIFDLKTESVKNTDNALRDEQVSHTDSKILSEWTEPIYHVPV
jgi:hypothetical protein